jgi:hypothetical protein
VRFRVDWGAGLWYVCSVWGLGLKRRVWEDGWLGLGECYETWYDNEDMNQKTETGRIDNLLSNSYFRCVPVNWVYISPIFIPSFSYLSIKKENAMN